MKRIYGSIVTEHFNNDGQMLFLAGPRQVGKTTISLHAQELTDQFVYLNWDNQDDQALILNGPKAIIQNFNLQKISEKKAIVVFDEIHKYRLWRNFIKGFYDTYKEFLHIMVTGSSRLDIFRSGGDSLMGRYFPYRIHPFSVAECIRTTLNEKLKLLKR